MTAMMENCAKMVRWSATPITVQPADGVISLTTMVTMAKSYREQGDYSPWIQDAKHIATHTHTYSGFKVLHDLLNRGPHMPLLLTCSKNTATKRLTMRMVADVSLS